MSTGNERTVAPAGPVRRRLAALAGVFLLALGLRLVPIPVTLAKDGVAFPGGADEIWHMRRIWYSVVNFPDSMPFDNYSNYPEGRREMGPPAFDLGIAAVARLLAGREDQVRVEWVAACVPPVLGAAAAATLAAAVWSAFGAVAGATAGVLLAVLPGHFFQSQVGLVDHHVLVTWLMAFVLLFGLRGLARDGGAGPGVFFGFGLALGALPGVSMAAFVHVPIVQAMLVGWLLAAPDRATAMGRALRAALAMAAAVVPVAYSAFDPPWPDLGRWTPMAPSSLQALYFLVAAATFGAVALVWRGRAGAGRVGRAASAGAVGGAILLVCLAAVPGLADGLRDAQWFMGRESGVLAYGFEVQPLLRPMGAFTLAVSGAQLSHAVLAFPLVWIALAAGCLRRGEGADRWLLLFWSAASFAAALEQIRFVGEFAVLFAAMLGWATDRTLLFLRGIAAARPVAARLAAAALLLACAWALLPVAHVWAVQLQEAAAGRRPPSLPFVPGRLAEQAARWMQRETPPTSGYLDASVVPEYGVLTAWSNAHMIRYRGERPVLVDGRGELGGARSAEITWAYFAATDEAEALSLLAERGVRYVVADQLGAGTPVPYAAGTMTDRLARLFGSSGQGATPDGAPFAIPALERHRLVYVTAHREARGAVTWSLGVYEVVPGAEVVGRADPGARVEATLPLAADGGFSHVYRAVTEADATGRWSLRLPYGNDGVPGGAIRVGRLYAIASGEERQTLAVPEAAVRAGAVLEGPSFGRTGPAEHARRGGRRGDRAPRWPRASGPGSADPRRCSAASGRRSAGACRSRPRPRSGWPSPSARSR